MARIRKNYSGGAAGLSKRGLRGLLVAMTPEALSKVHEAACGCGQSTSSWAAALLEAAADARLLEVARERVAQADATAPAEKSRESP